MPASLKDFRVEALPTSKIIGRKVACKCGHPDGNPIGAFWGQCFHDGTIQKLQSFAGIREPVPLFGWIGNFDHAAGTFDYLVATLTRPEAEPFDGSVAVALPALRYAVGTIEGTVPDLFFSAPALVRAEVEKRGLRRHSALDFEMEGYDERFRHDAPTTVIEFWVPLAE